MLHERTIVYKNLMSPFGSWWKRIKTLPSSGIVIGCLVLSIFLGLFYHRFPQSVFSSVGVVLGVVNALLAILYLVQGDSRFRWWLLLLSFAQFEILYFTYKESSPPSSLRLLQVGIITVYVATFPNTENLGPRFK